MCRYSSLCNEKFAKRNESDYKTVGFFDFIEIVIFFKWNIIKKLQVNIGNK